jgi:2-amino-4-hydroxy-6-hydroxymethyldihydropteridine diphosphokinase
MNECIIGIGSNIDADNNIQKMLRLLSGQVDVLQVSRLVQTKPIGIINQPDYTNGAVRILTDMDIKTLSLQLKQLEDRLCRDRTQNKFGPRTIDLDILIWNNAIVDPDYFTRDFLRDSAAELGFEENR